MHCTLVPLVSCSVVDRWLAVLVVLAVHRRKTRNLVGACVAAPAGDHAAVQTRLSPVSE
jgi:hypothetical protein